jgi:hypothetical protein
MLEFILFKNKNLGVSDVKKELEQVVPGSLNKKGGRRFHLG